MVDLLCHECLDIWTELEEEEDVDTEPEYEPLPHWSWRMHVPRANISDLFTATPW